jgi:hypothetical protein
VNKFALALAKGLFVATVVVGSFLMAFLVLNGASIKLSLPFIRGLWLFSVVVFVIAEYQK